MFRKFMVSLLVVGLLCCLVVPAFGTVYDIMDWGLVNRDGWVSVQAVYPNASSYVSAAAESFTGDGHYLDTVTVWLQATGPPSGHIICSLWNSSMVILENSTDEVDVAGVSTSSPEAHLFNFPADVLLTEGEIFYVGVFDKNGSFGAGQSFGVAVDLSGGPTSGSEYHYESGGWDNDAAYDLCMMIISTDQGGSGTGGVGGGGQTGGGSGGSGNTWGSGTTSSLYDVLVIIGFLFGPACVLAVLGFGKWGFIGGFTVGALALCTCVNVVLGRDLFPVWGLYGVFLVDVAVVWGSAKGVF